MIMTTYCTAQSLILQLSSSDELSVLLWVSVIEVTVGAGGGPKVDVVKSMNNNHRMNNFVTLFNLLMSTQQVPNLRYHHTLSR